MLTELLKQHHCNESTIGDEQCRLTYEQFHKQVLQQCGVLADAGITANQLVLYQAENTLKTLVLTCAIMELGAVAVPVNPSFSALQLDEIRQLNHYSCFINKHHSIHFYDKGSVDKSITNAIFTSGSTGVPKLVCHRYRNHIASAEAAACINPTSASDHWHLSLPLFHIGGFSVIFRAFLAGASLTIGGRVEESDFLLRMGITHASMVATQLQRFKASYSGESLALKTLLIGGGPTSEKLMQSCTDLPLRRTYGMSEISSQACTENEAGVMELLPSVKMQISEKGEIELSGESLFAGYLLDNKLELPGDYFRTGDIGFWENQQLYITGRKDNQFISGGENIQPEVIEKQLLKIPGVEQAVVVPVPSEEFGLRPFAWLDSDADFDGVRKLLRESLPGFMQPVDFAPIPEKIINQGLKLSRKVLTELAKSMI